MEAHPDLPCQLRCRYRIKKISRMSIDAKAALAKNQANYFSVLALPVRALPVHAVPVRALPVRALPVRALPVRVLPVRALPVRALEGLL